MKVSGRIRSKGFVRKELKNWITEKIEVRVWAGSKFPFARSSICVLIIHWLKIHSHCMLPPISWLCVFSVFVWGAFWDVGCVAGGIMKTRGWINGFEGFWVIDLLVWSNDEFAFLWRFGGISINRCIPLLNKSR